MKAESTIRLLVFLNLGLIVLDRLTKWIIWDNTDLYRISYGRLIEFKLFKNPNLYFISFDSILLYFLIGAALLLPLFLFFKSWQKEDFLSMTGFSLITLGGLSNLFDRIYFGYVVDWIRIFFLPISIFNIADIMIIGGILCLIFRLAKS